MAGAVIVAMGAVPFVAWGLVARLVHDEDVAEQSAAMGFLLPWGVAWGLGVMAGVLLVFGATAVWRRD